MAVAGIIRGRAGATQGTLFLLTPLLFADTLSAMMRQRGENLVLGLRL